MAGRASATRSAGAAAVAAAAIWSTYYPLVLLATSAVGTAGLIVWPFFAGALGFIVAALLRGQRATLRALLASPGTYLRAGLLLAMQLSVVAATLRTGAVDTALLTLVGDVALTPLLAVLVARESAGPLRSWGFLVGLALSGLGAGLTIVGGTATRPIAGPDWLLVLAVPITVAGYFLATARANRERPVDAVVAQNTLIAALLGLMVAPWLPAGLSGLAIPSAAVGAGLIAFGVTTFYLGPALYFAAIRKAGIVLPAVLMSTIPVFTLVLSVTFLHFVPGPLALVGVPLAVLGALLAARPAPPVP